MDSSVEKKKSEVILNFQVETTLKALVYGLNDQNIQSAWEIDGIKDIRVIEDDEDSAEFIKIKIKADTEEAAEKARKQLYYLTDSVKVPLKVLEKICGLMPEIVQKSSIVCATLGDKGRTRFESEIFICGTEEAVETAKFLMNLHVKEQMMALGESEMEPPKKSPRKFKSFLEIRDNMQEYLDQIEPGPCDYARQTDTFAKRVEPKFFVVPKAIAASSVETKNVVNGRFSPILESVDEESMKRSESRESLGSSQEAAVSENANISSRIKCLTSDNAKFSGEYARKTDTFAMARKKAESLIIPPNEEPKQFKTFAEICASLNEDQKFKKGKYGRKKGKFAKRNMIPGNVQSSVEFVGTKGIIKPLFSSSNDEYARETDTFAMAQKRTSPVAENVASSESVETKEIVKPLFSSSTSEYARETDTFAMARKNGSHVSGNVASTAKSGSSITHHSSLADQEIDALATTKPKDSSVTGNVASSAESVETTSVVKPLLPSTNNEYARETDTFAMARKRNSLVFKNLKSFVKSVGTASS